MSTKSFNKQNLPSIRADINEALAAVAAKHGIVLSLDNISFTESTFSSKINAAIVSGDTEDTSVSATLIKEFNENAFRFGYKPTDFGREVKVSGYAKGAFNAKLVGIKYRSKSPIIVQTLDGKLIKVIPQSISLA